MMTIENARKATKLADERAVIAAAKFTKLVGTYGQANYPREVSLEIDDRAWAIEERRTRKLAEIDAQLREPGVEPPQREKERGR
jgi:hypothetical protein